MKYGQFVNARKTLQKISGFELPVRDAFKVYKLMKELGPIYEFGADRETKLIEKYNGKINDDGSIGFIHGDDEKARADGANNLKRFVEEMNAMREEEIEGEFTPVKLKYGALGKQTITPNELMAIEGFISFE